MKFNRHVIAGRAYALILALLGAVLLAGGVKLLWVGGSSWYAGAGLVLMASAALLWRGSRWGSWLYGALLVCTVVWSLQEAGFETLALAPRLGLLLVLGLWFLTPLAQGGLRSGPPRLPAGRARREGAGARAGTWFVVLAGFMLFAGATWLQAERAARASIAVPNRVRTSAAPASGGSGATPAGEWRYYGNDASGTRYSGLAQLQPGNVVRLRLAWSLRTGDPTSRSRVYNFEATPLKVGRLLYACTSGGQVLAIEAGTGKLVWRFDAPGNPGGINWPCRGVSYDEVGPGECGQRIVAATPDNRLWSLDAHTGNPCTGFGEQGAVNLLVGLGVVAPGSYAVTSPPVVTHGRIVVGAAVEDNVSLDMPSGVVRAYDALTGQLAWAWDVGRPDRRDAPPPEETYTRSTPNAWAPMVADDALGLVYVPTGNPAGDFWGANRRPFDERYGSSLVALDVTTGTVRWQFQTTHHDLWDNDLCAPPVLVDLPGETGPRHAVIIGTKQGDLYVLDRATGEPIVPIEERPAPGPSDIGEPLARTQPASALALNPGVPRLTEQSLWGLTPLDQMWCRIQFRRARYEGPYTPPGISRPSIVYPGAFGGIEWGGVSVDPQRRILVANPSAMPFIALMARVRNQAADAGRSPAGMSTGLPETLGTGYAATLYAFLNPLGLPCMQPPWGKLYAIDLDTWGLLWERPVGTARDSGPFGIATHLPLLIGTPQAGGTLVTRGGLIFAGATLDRYLRAYDLSDGRELWKARLPAGGQATPMSYEADGRQFVVIAAGGHSALGTKAGDYLLAYALDASAEPESASTEH